MKISQLNESKDSRRGQPGAMRAHKGLSVLQREHLDCVVNSTTAASTFMSSLSSKTERAAGGSEWGPNGLDGQQTSRPLLHHLRRP